MLGLTCTISLVWAMPALTLAGEWSRIDTAADPGARNGFAMAHDGARERVVLMGGHVLGSGAQNDVWELDGDRWQSISADDGPDPRWNHDLVFDGAGLLLVGGEDDSGGVRQLLGDAWRWQGSWTAADDGPPARARHAVAYDSVRNRVVLFGGAVEGDTAGDTWEWEPGEQRWSEPQVSGPDPRRDHAMAFDGSRVVLFGGLAEGYLGDTWTFDGVAWERVAEDGPSPRAGHAMAGGDGIVVAFGGQGENTIYGDTWIWDGSWTRVASTEEGPGRRFGHAMVWDGGRAVMFGGNTPALDAQTWVYTPDTDEVPTDDGGTSTDDGDTQTSGETDGDGDADADGDDGGGCGCRLEQHEGRPLAGLLFGLIVVFGSRRRGFLGGPTCAS